MTIFHRPPYNISSKFIVAMVALAALVAAQEDAAQEIFNGYVFSDGYLEVLGGEPDRSFACEGRPYGYYADVANDCR